MKNKKNNYRRKSKKHPLKLGLFLFIMAFIITSLCVKFFSPNIQNSFIAHSARKVIDSKESDESNNGEEFVENKESINPDQSKENNIAKKTEEENNKILEKETDDNSFDNIKLSSVAGPLKYYNQLDPRWKDLPFGSNTKFTIGTDACGPTVMATIISSLTDNEFDPVSMTDWADKEGYLASGGGVFHEIIPGTCESFGLKVKSLGIATKEELLDELKAGNLIVELTGNGIFSEGTGHFIILIDYTNDDSIYISDPAHVKNIYKKWDADTLIREASRAAQDGGPFWVISK